MRISDWSSDVCSSDLRRDQLDDRARADRTEHRLKVGREPSVGFGVTEREKQTSFCKVSWASGNRLGDRSVLITGRRTSTGYCVRTNSMFLFGQGATDGVASELLGTISRILDASGQPLSARATVKALEQSGERVPTGDTPWQK